MKHSSTGPITRLVTRPIRSYFNIMAAVMLDGIKKDHKRPSSGKRLITWGGKENTPPPVSKSAMSPLGRQSEDPAERVLSPRASSRRTVRTSTPTCADSGNDSEGEMLPTYEVMMRETFSPISPTPLSPIIPDLPDLIEEATRSLQDDVKPTTEVRAAPPADTPVVSGVDEAGFTVGNGVPMYSVPPPNFMFSMPNVPIGAALTHRAAVDTPCSRTCILVPSQYAGVVQRVYGGDPVVTIQATSFTVAGTRNVVQVQGSLPGPATHYIGPVNVNGYTSML